MILWLSEGYRSWGRKFSMIQQEWNANKTTIVWNEGNKLNSSKTLHETEIYPIETKFCTAGIFGNRVDKAWDSMKQLCTDDTEG